MKFEIPADANKLIKKLQDNGFSAYVVGGCVRDFILGLTPHDWDICTSATPNQILEVFKCYKIIETGLQHGTVTIVLNGEQYEITTYRIDGEYTDNRRPDSVEFTTDLVEDLRRRDFTMNAIAYNETYGMIDPFGGLTDIKNKTIKCVGSAKERFSEDTLRILRAIRFAAQLDFTIDEDTDSEIHKQYNSLNNISMERITSEFCKIVKSKSFPRLIELYKDVFSFIVPEINDMIGFKQNNPYHIYDVFDHTVAAIKNCDSEDLITRLATLFHDIGKPHCFQDGEDGHRHFKGHGKVSAEMTDKIMRRMKFDNDTREKVVELVTYHDSIFNVGEKYIKRWLNKIGEDQFRRLIVLRRADIKAQNPIYAKERLEKVDNVELSLEKVLEENLCFTLKDLAVNGRDLIELGYKQSKEIGVVLNNLLEKVIDGDVANDKEELLKIVNNN